VNVWTDEDVVAHLWWGDLERSGHTMAEIADLTDAQEAFLLPFGRREGGGTGGPRQTTYPVEVLTREQFVARVQQRAEPLPAAEVEELWAVYSTQPGVS
jgi:hypothetical protein